MAESYSKLLGIRRLDSRLWTLDSGLQASGEQSWIFAGARVECIKDSEQSAGHFRYAAHSPLRISGSVVPLLRTPSMSSFADPIMKSTCAALRLPPACSNSASLISLPPFQRELVRVAERNVARGVLVEQRVVVQQPRLRDRRAVRNQRHFSSRRAPSSVSSSRCSVSAFLSADILTMRPRSNVTLKPSISVLP